MTPNPPHDPSPFDPSEILTSPRLGAAIDALAHPDQDATHSAADLDEHERHVIRHALSRSSHPFVAFPHDLLDQWDQLEDDDRTAGLLLFAHLTSGTRRRRDTGHGLER